MTTMLVLSLCVGIIGGAVHGHMARRYNKALFDGEIPNRFGVRSAFIFFRTVMTFITMALVLWTGLFSPLFVGIGMAIGFIGFNVMCAVTTWM